MIKVNQLLDQITKKDQAGLTINANSDNQGLEVTFPNGRRQRMVIERREDRYVLTSVVLKRKQVKAFNRAELLLQLWERNREINVVAFRLDRRGRLVGQVEQLAETIDPEELAFYIELLARECDQLEYMLTGQDRE